eukprot:g73538.t1
MNHAMQSDNHASQQLDQGDPGGDMHQQMDGQVQQQMDGQVLEATPMSSTECVHCGEELSYPSSSLYIQCPKCCQTMNPHSPHAKYMNCIGCNTLLSHPPSSLTIQCPKCLVIMELPVQVKVMRAPPQVLPGESLRRFRKKRKDPNAPKRASNAYMIFCKERRAELKETRPELAFGKLGAKLGEIWRTMSSEEKKPYEDRAAMDRDRYQKEMLIYQTKGIMNMEPAAKRQHVGDANEPGGRHHVQQELGEGGGVDPQSMGADMRMWNGRAEDNALSTLIGMPGQQQGQGGAPPATKTEHGQPSSSPTPQTDSTSGNHVAYGMAGPGGSVKNDVDSEDSEEADEDGMNDEDEEQAMPKVAKEPSTSHVDQTGQAEAEVQ